MKICVCRDGDTRRKQSQVTMHQCCETTSQKNFYPLISPDALRAQPHADKRRQESKGKQRFPTDSHNKPGFINEQVEVAVVYVVGINKC